MALKQKVTCHNAHGGHSLLKFFVITMFLVKSPQPGLQEEWAKTLEKWSPSAHGVHRGGEVEGEARQLAPFRFLPSSFLCKPPRPLCILRACCCALKAFKALAVLGHLGTLVCHGLLTVMYVRTYAQTRVHPSKAEQSLAN